MKITPQSISLSFLWVFAVLIGLFPASAFALSGDTQQHFTQQANNTFYTCAGSNWCVTSSTGTYVLKTGGVAGSKDTINSITDVSAQYVTLYSTSPVAGASVTVTYKDPAATGTGGLIEIDVDSIAGVSAPGIYVTDTSGTPVSVFSTESSNDVLPFPSGCWYSGSNPTLQNNLDAGDWETVVQDVSSLSNPVSLVQLVFTDNAGSIGQFSGYILLDNLRQQPILSCFTATNSPTPGPNTATMTATCTATFTATNTVTYTKTPASTNTQTYTPTVTNTPGITNTQTVTATFTPAACVPYVYPNPMDFSVNHPALANVPPLLCNSTYGANKCMVFSCIPVGSSLKIYTVSLALVRSFDSTAIQTSDPVLPSGVGAITWDGTTNGTSAVSSGLYFYTINGGGTSTFGKFAISKSVHGP